MIHRFDTFISLRQHTLWRTVIALLVASLFLSLATAPAYARSYNTDDTNKADHRPLFKNGNISTPQNALHIPDPVISWAIYASLDHPGETDYYSFQAKPGLALNVQVNIPALASLQNYAPHLALIGPGLPAPTDATPSLTIPSGDGVQIVNATHAGATDGFYEPFTQTNYWQRQSLIEPLAQSGTYYLVIFSLPADKIQTGKYVLAVGTKEVFGPGDTLSFPVTYIKVRQFMEAGVPTWGWIATCILVLVIALFVLRHRRKPSRSKSNGTPPVTPSTHPESPVSPL